MTETIAPPAPTRLLGSSGIEVSSIAWGMWRFYGDDIAAARQMVEAVLAAGITLFDTADIYGEDHGFGACEELLGHVLREAPSLRDRMVLATKGGIRPDYPYDCSARWLAEAIDGSLRRLGTERIDLYQIHRPDILAHPQEVAHALEEAHAAGKIRAIGVSNHLPSQIEALAGALSVPIVSHQIELSPLETVPLFDGTLDQTMARSMAVLAWSPFAGGRLTNPSDERERAVCALLDRIGEEAGADRAAAACAWLMAHRSHPIPIFGTQRAERIARVGEAYRVLWSRPDWYRLLTLSLGRELP